MFEDRDNIDELYFSESDVYFNFFFSKYLPDTIKNSKLSDKPRKSSHFYFLVIFF